ncbi:MAG: endonuclease/exonuclease/phosphatase family protein [Candidatus Levybacteria bacterium]|nr:endonuclease/exonuclease/phosphatase family protein [Candidatus Levybacteria bacterium]
MLIKTLSWNIWFGRYYHDIITHLKNADADIIALQEVIQNLDGSDNVAGNIAKELGYHWKYAQTQQMEYEDKIVSWGNAILSRHHILDTKVHALSTGDSRRTALQATIQIDETHLNVFSTHLMHTHQKPSELQEQQAEALVKRIPKEKSIVMGDFNALPQSNAVKYMTGVLQQTDTQLDPTWCVYIDGCEECKLDQLIHRLDYVFTTGDFKVHSFQTDYSKGSDHLPIAATLEI